MISASAFSRGYTTFWNELFPWLNNYSQMISKDLSTRIYQPLSTKEEPKYRSINNIIAFTYYKNICNNSKHSLSDSVKQAMEIISNYSRNNTKKYSFSPTNKKIVTFQADKLLSRYGKNVVIYPSFPGCGILNNCYGDILKSKTLIEVKAGERGILASDLRQLITYCALNWLNKNDPYTIDIIEIFNPRQGLVWKLPLRQLISSVSDLPLEELFDAIGQYLTDMSDEMRT